MKRYYCSCLMIVMLLILVSCSNQKDDLKQEITTLTVQLSQLDDKIEGAKKKDGWMSTLRDNDEVKALKKQKEQLEYILAGKEKELEDVKNKRYVWPTVKFLLKVLFAPFLVKVFRRDAFKGGDSQNFMIDIAFTIALLIVIFVIF